MMRKPVSSGKALVTSLRSSLESRLPATWRLDAAPSVGTGPGDADLVITAPDGTAATVIVEPKRQLTPARVADSVRQLRRYADALDAEQPVLLVAASYLSPNTRQALRDQGVAYFDLTGNLWLAIDRPAVLLEAAGADANPTREPRSLRSLKGPAAGRVVRALVDYAPPLTLSELAELAGVAIGSAHRVVTLLEAEGLVHRESRGPMEEVDWSGVVHRWTHDYSFMRSNRVVSCLDPRGALAFLDRIATAGRRYALTGALATLGVAPSVPPRLAAAFVDSPERTADELGLRPMEAGANVLLAEPFDDVVYERTWSPTRSGPVYAALSQVAADLLTSPGRGPVGGEELVAWMREHEEWRSERP